MGDDPQSARERHYASRVLELERELLQVYEQLRIKEGELKTASEFADHCSRELVEKDKRIAELEAELKKGRK